MSAQTGNEIFKIVCTGSYDRELKLQIARPGFSLRRITSAPQIGVVKSHFPKIDTLGSAEPAGIVRGKLFGSVSVKYKFI